MVVANAIRQLFKQYGLPTIWSEDFYVTLSYPTSQRNVSLDAPGKATYFPPMFEPVVDDGSQDPEQVVPTYHGYSPSGAATGELVYVNYGSGSDYAYLDAIGVSLRNKVVITRYGEGFRGDKCAQAEARGAIGCLIYSDPVDDGYLRGAVYPDGKYRPPEGVQRGSIWSGSGDPTTPGWASTSFAPRLNLTEARDASNPFVSWALPKIPTMPLSYQDAKPFLESLGGLRAPANMSGSTEWLTGGYFIGPGPGIATINISNDFQVKTITNVYAKIPGSVEPDRVIMLGVHHDAWTYGGADPISGTVSMLEVAKAFGKMYKDGWRPRRTIVFASWDAEEYATIGSSEFVELHYQEVSNRVVAYLNLDIAVSGTGAFSLAGTPNFVNLLTQITKLVEVPALSTKSKKTLVYDMWKLAGTNPENGNPILGSLGQGSDYSAFLQHAGISSLSMEFFDPQLPTYPQYHSRYDSYNFVHKFVDPDWSYHMTVSKVLGLVAKSLSDSFILPYDFVDYAAYLRTGLSGLRASISPKLPTLDYSALENAIQAFYDSAIAVRKEVEKLGKDKNPDPFQLRAINDRLFLTERAFLNYQGLPGQPWLRHTVYAPSTSDSYSSSMFPLIVNAAATANPASPSDVLHVQRQILFTVLYIDAARDVLTGGNGFV